MGTRRHPRGSPLSTRWAREWRGDDPRLSQFLRATNSDKLSEERKQIHLIRKIRNEFAHKVNFMSLAQVSFSQSPIKELCLQLDEVKVIKFKEEAGLSDHAARFITSSGFLWLALIYRREKIVRREEAQSITEDDFYSRISKMEAPAK